MKWVVIALVGWLLVMASVVLVGGVLDSVGRMVGAGGGGWVRTSDQPVMSGLL